MVSKTIPNFPTGWGEGGGSQYAIYAIIFIEPRGGFAGIRHSRELRAESWCENPLETCQTGRWDCKPLCSSIHLENVSFGPAIKALVFHLLSNRNSPWMANNRRSWINCGFSALTQDVNEMNQWLSAIRKTTISNPKMLSCFHPGVFHKNKWTCCKRALRQG